MIVHFICRGNSYRSRLAEAYLNSKQLPNFKAISSGITASKNENGPVSWYAQRIIEKEKLVPFESNCWQQTSTKLLKDADFTMFMEQEYCDFCKENLGFKQKNYEIWDVKDLDKFLLPSTGKIPSTEMEKMQASDATFEIIKGKVDDLIRRISTK